MEVTIKWNWNDIKSVERAEKKKLRLENKGFNLIKSVPQDYLGNCSLIYYKP